MHTHAHTCTHMHTHAHTCTQYTVYSIYKFFYILDFRNRNHKQLRHRLRLLQSQIKLFPRRPARRIFTMEMDNSSGKETGLRVREEEHHMTRRSKRVKTVEEWRKSELSAEDDIHARNLDRMFSCHATKIAFHREEHLRHIASLDRIEKGPFHTETESQQASQERDLVYHSIHQMYHDHHARGQRLEMERSLIQNAENHEKTEIHSENARMKCKEVPKDCPNNAEDDHHKAVNKLRYFEDEIQRTEDHILIVNKQVHHAKDEIRHAQGELRRAGEEVRHAEDHLRFMNNQVRRAEDHISFVKEQVHHAKNEVRHAEDKVRHAEDEVHRDEDHIRAMKRQVCRAIEHVRIMELRLV